MSATPATRQAALPGRELLTQGVQDLAAGRETEAALLVQIAAPRLRSLGVEIKPQVSRDGETPEHRLYALLAEQPGAHSRYNALIARIASYARAAEHAATR